MPLRKVFEIPKAFWLSVLFLGSLWILGDLDSSCVLKLSLLRSEYSDLLSDCRKSLSDPVWAKADPEIDQFGSKPIQMTLLWLILDRI